MLRLTRPLSVTARRQLVSRPLATQIRGYAERSESMLSSDPNFRSEAPRVPKSPEVPTTPPQPPPVITPPPAKPATSSQPSPSTPPVAKTTTVDVSTSPAATTTIPLANVPKVPPPPTTSTSTSTQTIAPPTPPPTTSTSTQTTGPPPPPPSPPPASPPPPPPTSRTYRRLRLLFWLTLVSALGYGGAVFFALRNDNFHDFFTEYVPFGEEAVLFFEERAFRRKFPNAQSNVYRSSTLQPAEEKRVKIPSESGLSWKTVSESKGSDVSQRGKHMSAVDDAKAVKDDAKASPDLATTKEKSAVVSSAKKEAGRIEAAAPTKPAKPVKVEAKPAAEPKKESKLEAPPAPAPPSPATPSPKSDPRPPVLAPVAAISTVNVPNADEPVVQELVKIINDLITVVNADGADVANKYSAPMEKAKASATTVASKITALRDAERAAAEERIKDMHKEFDDGARKLLEQVKTAQREEDAKYREEFESERAKIVEQYEKKLKAEIERTEQVLTQKFQNEISEQSIKMKKTFIEDIQGLVESERDGRLSKLTDLTSNVDNLTQLTSNWNGIIDANLATQKLQVAVDAVRSALDTSNAAHKPTPFVREMAALKLIADSDTIVDAAVASINPTAYQRGIPSSAQLIDRFRRVANEVRKASLLPENAGVASHAASFILSKVMFQKRGVPEGGDVESILTRTETLLEEGDLDSAAREMNELKGWAGVLSRDWLNDARKVLEVKQALDVIETEARLQCLRVE